nr:mitochondrial outer membrane protein porin of 34 kDa [Ipomoea batatas]
MLETPFPLLFEFNTREPPGASTQTSLHCDCVSDFQLSRQIWEGSKSLHPHRQKARDLLYRDYTHIGKKARDLLYRDYQTDHKFTITTYSPTGVAITSTRSKKGDLFFGDVNTQLKNNNITTDIKVDTNSNVFTTITVDEATPGIVDRQNKQPTFKNINP